MPFFAYCLVLAIPPLSAALLVLHPVSPWLLAAAVWIGIPFLDVVLPASRRNAPPEEEAALRKRRAYDVLLWLAVPIQLFTVVFFAATAHTLTPWDLLGGIVFTGTACGVLAINVGHELGHRPRPFEQRLAKLLLLTSLYTHFFVEHNRGHHAKVATPEDPASARSGENVYQFWVRSIAGSLRDAWTLEATRLERKGVPALSLQNEVLRWKLAEGALLLAVASAFGLVGLTAFVGSAVFGFTLLETVNYVEHYGLERHRRVDGTWERVRPAHSWTSDHPASRALLFDLPRHADHHASPGRPFQVLRHMEDAPELPTGYAGMVLLALVPPLYFAVMRRRLTTERARLDSLAGLSAAHGSPT